MLFWAPCRSIRLWARGCWPWPWALWLSLLVLPGAWWCPCALTATNSKHLSWIKRLYINELYNGYCGCLLLSKKCYHHTFKQIFLKSLTRIWSNFLMMTTLSPTTASVSWNAKLFRSIPLHDIYVYGSINFTVNKQKLVDGNLSHSLATLILVLSHSPSLLASSRTKPLRQASVISEMLLAQRPIAWMVAAANSLSELVTYV